MANAPQLQIPKDLMELFRQFLGLRDLQFFLNETGSSVTPLHRQSLRQFARQQLELWAQQSAKNMDPKDLQDLANLAVVPELKNFLISVSHCPEAGGVAFVACDTNLSRSGLGLDIEPKNRVNERAVSRVSSPESSELLQSRSPGHLWTAKESAFKSLHRLGQPKVISEVSIAWLMPGDHPGNSFWKFEYGVGSTTVGQGAVAEVGNLLCAIATPTLKTGALSC